MPGNGIAVVSLHVLLSHFGVNLGILSIVKKVLYQNICDIGLPHSFCMNNQILPFLLLSVYILHSC